MSKKSFRPPRLAPLQRVVAEPINDPAERAALDKARKRHKRKQKVRQVSKNRNGVPNAQRTNPESR